MDRNHFGNIFWMIFLLTELATNVADGRRLADVVGSSTKIRDNHHHHHRHHRHRQRSTTTTAGGRIYGLCPDHPSVRNLLKNLNKTLNQDVYYLSDGISIKKDRSVQQQIPNDSTSSSTKIYVKRINGSGNSNGELNMCEYVAKKAIDFTADHYLDINLAKAVPTTGRLLSSINVPRFGFGKNSFLTGFGLGFLAFGLKKLLLPIFIGGQIIKSILIAMFLPSILGSVGKLVGKGVSTFAQSSGSSNYGAGGGSDNLNDFDFKDTQQQSQQTQQSNNYDVDSAGSDNAYGTVWTYPSGSGNQIGGYNNNYLQHHNHPQNNNNDFMLPAQQQQQPAISAFANGMGAAYNAFANEYIHNRPTKPTSSSNNRYNVPASPTKLKESTSNKYHTGSFYTKDKTEDFKVFHNIPSSSHLLANYDPFYSPLLSRIDSVFKQLGYSTETCRERLVCNMYKNPAKYAPFSNLVSAQLSRELNELRKPSSDNPEILRFFRYMKAAKDGQDGQECEVAYADCVTGRGPNENAPMVSTFNDINKLVQARGVLSS